MLKDFIVRLGHIRTILLITFVSLLVSVLVYFIVIFIFNIPLTFKGILPSLITPIVVAPIMSWYLSKLLFQIIALENKMRTLATIDSLTGLLTRQTFLNRISPLYELAKRNQTSFAILYMDLDNFKSINDTYGHHVGDNVLKSLGKILKTNKRKSDLVGRLGGEEFAYALLDIDAKGAMLFAEKIRKLIESDMYNHNGIYIDYTMSIGLSIYAQNNKVDLDDLITQADEALYLAKDAGKNCVKVY